MQTIRLSSHMVAIPTENIDTDQIIPAIFLKTVSKKGLGKQCFTTGATSKTDHLIPIFPEQTRSPRCANFVSW